jgi:hypothetical protein
MDDFHIDENYIKQERGVSPTELFTSHLMERDDDPNQEIHKELASLEKTQPAALAATKEVIQNFVLDAFDENGQLFRDTNCQTGTTINSVYGKLREIAYKHFLKAIRNYDAKTRAVTKMYFINKVDGEIFDRVRWEAISHYKKQLSTGVIPLPNEIKHFQKLIQKYNIKEKLYQCIAEWYVEAEVSIDIIRRIQMYGVLEGKQNKAMADKLKQAWELKSNYYIDFESAFLSMI